MKIDESTYWERYETIRSILSRTLELTKDQLDSKTLEILNKSLQTPNDKGKHNDVSRKQVSNDLLETDREAQS